MKREVLEKIYAGFLGMNAGIRLGAPVEPAFWDSENIRKYYGELHGYVKDYKHFAADDDANGPVFFLRALDDMPVFGEPAPQDVAEAWLNYGREGVGLYWWGGYGVSTEHTAYLNLKNGIPAPQSGSIHQNGKTLAEQIGGQIFIDTWGLIAPADPARAARYAVTAASVSHDGEGLHGAAFMAAAISKAFETSDMEEIIAAGLQQIPADCLYRKVFDAVERCYRNDPQDWRACLAMLQAEWGYDKYPGVCHIIPNAGVCALALYYGRGDFARTIELASMCGWDTDCNAGNVGTILGVAVGPEGIPACYRGPINDEIVLSGISGYLNILDIPSYSKKLFGLACRLAGEECPEPPAQDGTLHYDFTLPGATHGFHVSDPIRCMAQASPEHGGSLRCFYEKLIRGEGFNLFVKTFYRRRDFDDERYMPVFSPLAYPGQTASFTVALERLHGDQLSLTPYVKETFTGQEILLKPVVFSDSFDSQTLSFTLPDVEGGVIEEVGLKLTSLSQAKLYDAGSLYLTDFRLEGKGHCTLNLSLSKKEFASVLPFSHNHGAWELVDGHMEVMSLGHAEAMTGPYFARDMKVSGTVTPLSGTSHLMSVRVQGAQRGVYGGFGVVDGVRSLVVGKTVHGVWQLLTSRPFDWQEDHEYALTLAAEGQTFTLTMDGGEPLSVRDDTACAYGMVGYAQYAMGRTAFGNLTLEER